MAYAVRARARHSLWIKQQKSRTPAFAEIRLLAYPVFPRMHKQPTTSATADRSSALALRLWLSIHDRYLPAILAEQREVPEPRRLQQPDRRASAAYRADHAITFHYQITTLFPTLQVLLSPPSPFVLKRYTFTRRNVSGPHSALFSLFLDPIHI